MPSANFFAARSARSWWMSSGSVRPDAPMPTNPSRCFGVSPSAGSWSASSAMSWSRVMPRRVASAWRRAWASAGRSSVTVTRSIVEGRGDSRTGQRSATGPALLSLLRWARRRREVGAARAGPVLAVGRGWSVGLGSTDWRVAPAALPADHPRIRSGRSPAMGVNAGAPSPVGGRCQSVERFCRRSGATVVAFGGERRVSASGSVRRRCRRRGVLAGG